MNTNQLRIAILLSIAFTPLIVNANGINPPRPAGGTILEASCTDSITKTATVLRRVRVLTDDPAERIQFKIPPSTDAGIKLSDIRRIEIQSTTATANGFTAAQVKLLNPPYQGNAAVKLGKGAASLRLTGFNESNQRVQIVLAACKILEIRERAPAVVDSPKSAVKN